MWRKEPSADEKVFGWLSEGVKSNSSYKVKQILCCNLLSVGGSSEFHSQTPAPHQVSGNIKGQRAGRGGSKGLQQRLD